MDKVRKKEIELARLFDALTSRECRNKVNKIAGNIRDAEGEVKKLLYRLSLLEKLAIRKDWENAERIYKNEFIRTGKFRIKRAFSIGELKNFLKNRSVFQKNMERLRKTKRVLSAIRKKCDRTVDIYNRICNAKKYLGKYRELQVKMKRAVTPDGYRKYFKDVAAEFGGLCDDLSSVAEAMPPGAKEYCQFIFKGAQAILASVKIVDDHVKKIIDATKYLDKFRDVMGSKDVKANTGSEINNAIKDGDLNQKLDILLKRPR